jgi:trehalose-phosphatase
MAEDTKIELRETHKVPSVFKEISVLESYPENKKMFLFLDFDGTLSPIVSDPDKAIISDEMREVLKECAKYFLLAVVSGRDMDDVRERVDLEEIIYAGSHGFRITGPNGLKMKHRKSKEIIPDLSQIEEELFAKMEEGFEGVMVERKTFAIAVHYRNAKDEVIPELNRIIEEIMKNHPEMKTGRGKKIIEIKPDLDWHKGKALEWILEGLEMDNDPDVIPVYIGDDVTDEDAFKTIYEYGIGILVGSHGQKTAARYSLKDIEEVKSFLQILLNNKKMK